MMFSVGFCVRRFSSGSAARFGMILTCLTWSGAGLAEKLVDPNSVAPEYREQAEKRRAEQVKLFQCAKKADEAKVLRRDRTAFINQCAEK